MSALSTTGITIALGAMDPAVWGEAGAEHRFHVSALGMRVGPLQARIVGPAEPPEAAPGFGAQSREAVAAPHRALELTFFGMDELVREDIGLLVHALQTAERAPTDEEEEPGPRSRPWAEVYTDPQRIRLLVGALFATNLTGRLGSEDHVRAVTLSESDNEIRWTGALAWGDGPHVVAVQGYNSVFYLHFDSAEIVADHVHTKLPMRVERVRRRWLRRAAPQNDVFATFQHPLWPDLAPARRTVLDLSHHGMRLLLTEEDPLLPPEMVLEEILVESADLAQPIRLVGTVRFTSGMWSDASPHDAEVDPDATPPASTSKPAGRRGISGITVHPASPEDERRWFHFVTRHLYPNTDTSASVLDALWSLFEESGYFNLAGKSNEDFAAIREPFYNVARKAVDAPHIILQAVWPSSRGVECSVSFLKAYHKSWMGHQLAKKAGAPPTGDPGQVLRDVYIRTFEHPQIDRNFDWVVGYVEPTVKWMGKSHLDFVERYRSVEELIARPMDMMTVRCDEPSGVVNDIEVAPATQEEKMLLARTIARTRPHAYVDALDFSPEQIDMSSLIGDWASAGFERERAIFVARRRGKAIAASVLETGELGTNLFRLLDNMRIFPFMIGTEGHVALLDHARVWFGARKRRQFLFLREESDDSYAARARIHKDSEPVLWIISSRVIPEFLEHVCEMTGLRKRLRQIRSPHDAAADQG